ncbi:hypothetical protein DFH06DRAFT_1336146 [Mycena polygramma]|nr:hypothetical protein DFH06DRAFT_1336146 [Mycena polygramma]
MVAAAVPAPLGAFGAPFGAPFGVAFWAAFWAGAPPPSVPLPLAPQEGLEVVRGSQAYYRDG